MRFFNVFITICLSLLIFINCMKLKYKLKLISIGDCKLPSNTYDQSHPVIVKSTMKRVNRDTTLIDFKFNITRRIGPIVTSARTFSMRQNSMRDLISKMEKTSCNSTLSKQVHVLLKLEFDHQCYALPGYYEVKDLNLNSLGIIMTTMAVGPGIYSNSMCALQQFKMVVAQCVALFQEQNTDFLPLPLGRYIYELEHAHPKGIVDCTALTCELIKNK